MAVLAMLAGAYIGIGATSYLQSSGTNRNHPCSLIYILLLQTIGSISTQAFNGIVNEEVAVLSL
eukprot:1578729-Amphidinium_carterae.1